MIHTLSGIGTSSWVPDGACTVSMVSPWKHRHTSSCVTYAQLRHICQRNDIHDMFLNQRLWRSMAVLSWKRCQTE